MQFTKHPSLHLLLGDPLVPFLVQTSFKYGPLAVNFVALLCTAPYFFHMVVREDDNESEGSIVLSTANFSLRTA